MTIRKTVLAFVRSASVAAWFIGSLSVLGPSAMAKPFAAEASSQAPQTLTIAPDSPRWNLEGQAKPVEYQGRKSLYLDGGGATLKDFEMRDGVVDVDVATPAARGFFGIQFRIAG